MTLVSSMLHTQTIHMWVSDIQWLHNHRVCVLITLYRKLLDPQQSVKLKLKTKPVRQKLILNISDHVKINKNCFKFEWK